MTTHYDTLRVSRKATPPQIRAAFLLLAKVYHPETTLGLEDGRFRELCEAYNVLVNPQERQEYDREILGRVNEIDPL